RKCERLQKDAIDHAKDRRIRPNSQSKRQDGNGGERKILAQPTRGIAYISGNRIHPLNPVHAINLLPSRCQIACSLQRRVARLVWRESMLQKGVDQHLKMRLHLFTPFLVYAVALQKVPPEHDYDVRITS